MATESPLGIIIGTVWIILEDVMHVLAVLVDMLFRLIKSLNPLSDSGPTGFIISIVVIFLVVFFIGRFVFDSGKSMLILIAAAVVLLVAGMAVFL